MVQAPGVAVPPSEAEATRRRLVAEGALRRDLDVVRAAGRVVFPVADGAELFDFPKRTVRPRSYVDLLDWPDDLLAIVPRAFDPLGDIVIIKVPEPLWPRRDELGQAILDFLPACRAVFHDRGVKGPFRVRDLERIAGDGGSQTIVAENGVRLHVDPARAYFSPRLADERARIAGLVHAGEVLVDLFGGVAPLGVQAARAGAKVTCVDINPAAVELALRNAHENRVDVDVIEGDARHAVGRLPAADRVVMNLPHGAKDFLDVAARVVRSGGVVHHHEILDDNKVDERRRTLAEDFGQLGRTARATHVRHVRAYSATDGHYAFDMAVDA